MPLFTTEKSTNWYALHNTYAEHNEMKKVRKYLYTNKTAEEQAFSLYRYFNKTKSIDYINRVDLLGKDEKFIYNFLNSSADILRYITFKNPSNIKKIILKIIDRDDNTSTIIYENNNGSLPFPLYGLPLSAMHYNTIEMTIIPINKEIKKCTFVGRWCLLNYNLRLHYCSLSHVIDFGNELYEITGGIILKKKYYDLLNSDKHEKFKAIL